LFSLFFRDLLPLGRFFSVLLFSKGTKRTSAFFGLLAGDAEGATQSKPIGGVVPTKKKLWISFPFSSF